MIFFLINEVKSIVLNFEMLLKNILPGFVLTISGLTHERYLCVYIYVKKSWKPIYYFVIYLCYL